IFVRSAIRAFLEIVEVDMGHVERVFGAQRDCPVTVHGMALENCPGQIVQVSGKQRRVSGNVTSEESQEREAQQVGDWLIGARFLDDADYGSVRSVNAFPRLFPFGELRVALRELGS